jgi:hypothetical protein
VHMVVVEPVRSSGAIVEIEAPIAGQRIAEKDAARYAFRLKQAGLPANAEVVVQLDDGPPRPATPDLRLGDLPLPPTRLVPGRHRLLVYARLPDRTCLRAENDAVRQPIAIVSFDIGTTASESGPTVADSTLLMLEPRGTYNGDAAADALRVDYYVARAPGEPREASVSFGVRVTIDGVGVHQHLDLVGPWQPALVSGLPSGDYRISLDALDAKGNVRPLPRRAERSVTLNRDVTVKASP